MIRLKPNKFCLYSMFFEHYLQMFWIKKITKFVLIALLIIYAELPIFSQNFFDQSSEMQFSYPFYYTYDSCIYFPEQIFTVGSYQTGIKFVQPNLIKNQKKNNGKNYEVKVENDTSSKGNRIISIRETEKGDKIAIYLQIENMDQRIKIIVYNLLGKKVLDIYDGKPKDSSQPYEFSTGDLPKGIFLLVVIGDNFRLREKLIITK